MSITAAANIQFQKPSINGPKGEDPPANASQLPTTGDATIIQKYSPNQPPARKARAPEFERPRHPANRKRKPPDAFRTVGDNRGLPDLGLFRVWRQQ
jgi:hypothetical protein